jgi:glycosyltransferase involved in cell wall biosynthesis
MEKLLTIVIAAYNKQHLLVRCLDSLIINTELMQKVQILIVNDGSTDKTLNVARSYELKYPDYFQVIDKKNGNYGSVMNVALPLAVGKYFKTLDADDWYDTASYTKFVTMLADTDADMIVTERHTFEEKKKTIKQTPLGNVIDGKDIPAQDAFSDLSLFNGCLNIQFFTYKTSILRESGLKWIEGVFYTDTMYDVWPLPFVRTVRFERLPVYVYVEGIDEQSMSVENTRKNVNHFITISKELIPYFIKHYDETASYTKVMKRFLFQLLYFIYRNMWIDDKYNKSIIETHHLLDPLPDVQLQLERMYTYHGINCLKDIIDNNVKVSFRIVRRLRKISQKIKKLFRG